jgi:ketosteroid isomerase-like protein
MPRRYPAGRNSARSAVHGVESTGAMSNENAELARALYDTWNGPNGPEEAKRFLSDDFEFVNPDNAVEPGTRRGHAGWTEAMNSLDAAFHEYEHEIAEVKDLGDRVLCFTTFVAKTSADSVAFRQDEQQLWTFQNGKIMRLEWFHDRSAALRAAGLPV